MKGKFVIAMAITFGVCLTLFYSSAFGRGMLPSRLSSVIAFITLGSLALFIIGVIILMFSGGSRPNTNWVHGTARFAGEQEVKPLLLPLNQPLPAGSFYLSYSSEGVVALPRNLAVQHGLVLGGSGKGKSRGYFLPNCAWSKNTSLVVTDPKGELWDYTSGFHPSPHRYAPSEPDASEPFNCIPLCESPRIAELCARALIESGNNGRTDQFWLDAEAAFLSALFAHTATLEVPTLTTAYRLFTRQSIDRLLDQLMDSPSDTAREQAIIFNQTSDRVKGGIVPAIAAKLQFLRDPAIARFTSASLQAPNFGILREQPHAVYYCLREQDITRLRPLTSLFFTIMLEQIAGYQIAEGSAGVPITMMLDEFANIGTLPDFATTISLARGRGVAIWIGVQSLAQLDARYGRANAQTIMSNCGTKIALHGLDVETANYVSRMLGDTTVIVPRESYNDGGGAAVRLFAGTHSSTTYSQAEIRRPLMTPDEVMRLADNEAIIRTGNQYPMRLWKLYYEQQQQTAHAPILGPAQALEVEVEREPQPVNNRC